MNTKINEVPVQVLTCKQASFLILNFIVLGTVGGKNSVEYQVESNKQCAENQFTYRGT